MGSDLRQDLEGPRTSGPVQLSGRLTLGVDQTPGRLETGGGERNQKIVSGGERNLDLSALAGSELEVDRPLALEAERSRRSGFPGDRRRICPARGKRARRAISEHQAESREKLEQRDPTACAPHPEESALHDSGRLV